MKHLALKSSLAAPITLCLLLAAPLLATAQTSVLPGPPKVLVIDREVLKPGKSGGLHEKTESNFLRAAGAAKTKTHYFGMDSMTGAPRSLFFFPYDSYAAWETDNLTNRKNATLSAALDHATNLDGELLSSYEQNVFNFRPDISRNLGLLTGKRYMEITQFVVKPGRNGEVEELIKMYMDTYTKAAPDANWASYELMYGTGTGDVFLFITSMKTLAETDQEVKDFNRFMDLLGEKGRKRFGELTATAVESMQVNLFELNPKISYPPEDFIKAEPDFWKPKATAPSKKPETAPTK